jgi:uncharacterized protein (TIRG00374 family)
VWETLRSSDYWWLVPAFVALVASTVVRATRWRYLFARETRPPLGPVLSATILGQFFNNVLPARAGEPARIIALNQSTGVSRAETTATVVVERAYDVLSLLALLFVAIPWLPRVTWIRAAGVLAIALTACLALTVFVLVRWGERPFRVLLRPLARLPFLSLERTEHAAAAFVRGAVALRHTRLAFGAIVLTSLSWLLLALSSWVLMRSFSLDLPFGAGVLVVVAIGLSMILPSSPAAVGVFEAATLIALRAYDVPRAEALSYALVLHVLNFLPYVAAGALLLQRHALSLRRTVA